jgi:hypothetical protein
MAENKTQETGASVAAFINANPNEEQRTDAKAIAAMMEELSGEPARMWGPSIIGFGRYRYKYESGREGEVARIGFSPRKGKLVVYLVDGFTAHGKILERLGKFSTGRSCLYIKKLSNVDPAVLRELVAASLAYMDSRYPR